MGSTQNERALGGGAGVLENEQGRTKRVGGGGSKLGNLEQTYFLNAPLTKLYMLFSII